MKNVLKGVISYPITPFTEQDDINHSLLSRIVDKMIKSGVHAIAPLGSAGVMPYLSDIEREEVTETVIQTVAKRVPTLVGVSSLTTSGTIHHAKIAEKLGASAIMVLPLSYWKLTEKELLIHFSKIADAVSLPMVLYNNPATSGIDLQPDMLIRLLDIPNITMIKESSGDIKRMHRLVEKCGKDITFFNGNNPMALDAFSAGASGWCTVAPHIIPELTLQFYEAIESGELKKAKILFDKQLPFLQFIVKHGLPRAISAALEYMGTSVGPLRLPLQPLAPELKRELLNILIGLGKVLP